MTTFLRLLTDKDKANNLLDVCTALRAGDANTRVFEVAPESFRAVPGAPFAYWVSEAVRQVFRQLPPLECDERTARQGLATAEDFRFVRTWWEEPGNGWHGFAKGGTFSPFYADVYLMTNWDKDGAEVKAGICRRYPYLNGNAEFVAKNPQFYLRPGLTWPRRTNGLSFRVMPRGCIFADKGPAAFVADDAPYALLTLCTLLNSQAFGQLVSVQLARVELAQSFEVGLIQQTPVPDLSAAQQSKLTTLARRAWSLKRTLDTTTETSHAFILPAALRTRLGDYDTSAIEAELARIQAEIDAIAFDLYGFSEADRAAVNASQGSPSEGDSEAGDYQDDEASDDEDSAAPIDHTVGLLSWALGVAFGRFDWRLATGERAAPAEPEPFDPLPAKSPGMLPDGAAPFHAHTGILVDDQGHPHDLARLVEEVLNRVDVSVPDDVRRWLQKDFFAFHLQRYSKSRRKAPIYWPLSTASGSYTFWIYYPSLNNQTLFTAVNDFLDGPNGKLTQVSRECAELRMKGSSRSRDEEKQYETLQIFEQELTDLRDALLKIAPTYQPNHDDGVQITAAPLWLLFRHKPWQKVLKDTWTKLEKGDYDWAHLAMTYWPERVREKCKTDKSLAIAHGLEDLYVEPEAAPKKTRSKKKEL
ncbi:type II restriction endonuclease subunit M [Alkanindiges illinoisensis]|uniref:Type II restriction endonuclease subunit M n=1 Tax=Alkanindiges illinoisensis TaxID=197183 RepID=A0A4Y7XBT6_9GAMM|nr:type II restriction endonuclease subunit M [Alkanindiges illinoisensis]TEU25819.1 type II restriction endonuclease subunit M [Alkanindiges illinoisensis]